MSSVELKAVQSGVRANFVYTAGITQIQLTLTDQAEVGHITGDIPLNTSSNHGAMTKTIYVDSASTSTFAILESGVSPDYFDFVEGVTYNVVAKFGMSSQTSTYTHDLPPVSADYSTVISHGNESLSIALTAANNNSANITSYLITIMGNDKTLAPATFQKSYDVDGNGNINESIDGTGSDFGLTGFVGQFQNGELLEIVIAAQNAAGYEFESVTYHASPTSTANEPTLVINSGIDAIDNNNLVSDEDLFVQIVPGVQIANAPDLFYLMAVNNQDGIKLYKKFEPSDLIVTDGELLSTGSSGWTVQNSGVPADGEVATPLAFVDGTEYTFDCWAANANGQSPAITSDNTGTPSGLPAEPTATTTVGSLNGVGSETIRVTIPVNPNSGNTLNNGSFITDYKITVGGNLTTVSLDNFDNSNTDAPFTDISGLTNGTDYGVSIVAVNANGDSTSYTASNAKPRTDPVAPTFVGGNNNEAGAAIPVQGAASTLNSGEVKGYVVALDGTGEHGGDEVISYVFEVSADSEFGSVVSSDNNAGVTENTFDSLIDGTLYYMRVKSVNSFGEESSYTVLGGDPLQPNDVPNAPVFVANLTLPAEGVASIINSGEVQGTVVALADTAAGGGTNPSEIKYTFEIDTQNDFGSGSVISQQGNATDVDQVFSGLTNGTLYYIRAKATNTFTDLVDNIDGRDSVWSDYETVLQPNAPPDAPTFNSALTIPDINNQSSLGSGEVQGTVVALADTAAGGGSDPSVVKYTFELDTQNDFGSGAVVSQQGENMDVDQLFTGLTNGTSYYIRAKATNHYGSDSGWVYYVDGNSDKLELVPSAAPTIDETGLNALLMASVKNTLVVANSNYFTVNIASVVNSVNTGGYDISEIVVTMSGNDSQSITVDLANINNDVVFNGVNQLNLPATNELGANNSGYEYTLSVSANNAIYTENNTPSSSTSTIHVTNTLLTASNISATLNSSDSITFTWDVPDFNSLNQFTNGDGSNFNLQLQEKVPTEDGGTNEVSYPASFSNVGSPVNVNIVSGTTSYSQAFADLRYGTIYSVAITTNSEQYDVNPSVSHATGPVNDATGLVPHTKPTVEVVDGVGDAKTVTIKSNGLVLDTSISLDSGSSDPVKDLSTELTASTTAAVRGAGNSFVTGGNPAFTLYKDANGDMAELVSSISYTPTGGDNYLLITENSGTYGGATVLLNGNPLGLSQA